MSTRPGRWVPAFAGTVALLWGATGCSIFGGAESGTTGAEPAQRTGLTAEADALLKRDREFAAKSAELGAAEAFHEFLDADGFRLAPAGDVPTGPKQVWASLAAAPKTVLHWEPRYAEVFAPGEWGWTWGEWQSHEPGAGGRRLAQGRYVTIWRKQPDGTWKVKGALPSSETPPR